MKLTKTLTGSAGGFVFTLSDLGKPHEFVLRIEQECDNEQYLNIGASKEKIEEFLEGCSQILIKLRSFQHETA